MEKSEKPNKICTICHRPIASIHDHAYYSQEYNEKTFCQGHDYSEIQGQPGGLSTIARNLLEHAQRVTELIIAADRTVLKAKEELESIKDDLKKLKGDN